MTKAELLRRVEELERRVTDLEARPPMVVNPVPTPMPTTTPPWQPRPGTNPIPVVWYQGPATSFPPLTS